MKKILYYLVKVIVGLQKLGKGGTSFPGKFALSRKPEILSEFILPEKRIFVSGTNGKTTIANALAKLFTNLDQKVTHNKEGANMIQGITTTLFEAANSSYEITSDHLILEIDELSMPPVFKNIAPQTILLTNLFDDQVDRYGGKWKLAKILSEQLPSDITLYLNADDPTLVWLSQELKPRQTIFFGIREKALATVSDSNFQIDNSAFTNERCPVCKKELIYRERYYESLGKFNCSCGFKSPKLDFMADKINLATGSFFVDEQLYQMPHQQLYFVYNMLAVITYALLQKVDPSQIAAELATKVIVPGRFEYLDFNQNQAWLNLVKNPAALNQSLEFIENELKQADLDTCNVYLALNNRPADGLDISWLKQGRFDWLKQESLNKIYLMGDLSQEVASLLLELEFPESKIEVVDNIEKTINQEKQNPYQNYFLSNVTILNQVRSAILK